MIGGAEVVLESKAGPEEALRQAFALIQHCWRNAVVENATTGELLHVAAPLDAFAGLDEIMVYRDADARRSWEARGADSSNANTMVHVMASATSVTLVVDDPSHPVMCQIVQDMKRFLAKDNVAAAG